MNEIILSERLKECTSEEFMVYSVLRADVEENYTEIVKSYKREGVAVSGISVQTIARFSGLTEILVKQSLDSLCRKQWIVQHKNKNDVLYKLGDIIDFKIVWMVDVPIKKKSHGVAAKIKRMCKEKKEREESLRRSNVKLSKELKQSIARDITKGSFSEQKPSQKLLSLFKNRYKDVVGDSYPSPPDEGGRIKQRSRDNTFMLKFYGYCDSDIIQAMKLMDFVFNNWKEVKAALQLVGVPTTGLFNTVSFIKKFKEFEALGISTSAVGGGAAKRLDETLLGDAANEGF